MTIVKEQAVELINHISDEKVMSVIAFVQNMQNETAASGSLSNDDEKRREAFEGLMELKKKLKRPVPGDFDYKKEWLEYVDDRYGRPD